MFGRRIQGIMASVMPNLRGFHLLPGAGHWTQQERPQETTAAMLTYLQRLDPWH